MKYNKLAAEYDDQPLYFEKPSERCGVCQFFNKVADTNPPAGICDLIDGIVNTRGRCKLYKDFRPVPRIKTYD